MNIPRHVAVIMDGNGRWARKKKLPRNAGHKEGVDRVKEFLEEAKKLGVEVVTVFAFSTENWRRPRNEINFIFSYFVRFLGAYQKELVKKGICFRVIGRRNRFPKNVLKIISETERLTRGSKGFTFNMAFDYGGRWDIVNAARKLIGSYSERGILPVKVSEKEFSRHLSLNGLPEPDLLIRTSGEQRLSNFLLWDLAYSEFYFTPVFWPEFRKADLRKAVKDYSDRRRRFGSIDA